MSKWLRSVGNFLEQLDDKAAVVVHQRQNEPDDEDDVALYTRDVLAAHGVLSNNELSTSNETKTENDPVVVAVEPSHETIEMSEENGAQLEDSPVELRNDDAALVSTNEARQEIAPPPSSTSSSVPHDDFQDSMVVAEQHNLGQKDMAVATIPPSPLATFNTPTPETPMFHTPAQISSSPDSKVNFQNSVSNDATSAENAVCNEDRATINVDIQVTRLRHEKALLDQTVQSLQNKLTSLQNDHQLALGAMGKEARLWKRQWTETNSQLEAAQLEMEAQRKELDNAATQLATNRTQQKAQQSALAAQHAAQLASVQAMHQEALAAAQAEAVAQRQALHDELSALQRQRQQEGGDWHEELSLAQQREAAAHAEWQLLHDENQTLVARIATLTNQQDALGSRLESLTAAADGAAAREREAEVRLDQALDWHAKHTLQRQAREAELERTVAELSAALASASSTTAAASESHEAAAAAALSAQQAAGDQTAQDIDGLVELETLKSQLEQERQQCATMRRELQEVVAERTVEERTFAQRQLLHDRKVSELTQQVTELRAAMRDKENGRLNDNSTLNSTNNAATTARLSSLTEQVVRLRDRHSASQSEIATLRVRLQDALNRATIAEAAAESNQYSSASGAARNDLYDDDEDNDSAERGIVMRRRNGTRRAKPAVPTMRAALSLDSLPVGDVDSRQRIGKSLDTLDTFLLQSGKVLRYNPMARLLFGTLHVLTPWLIGLLYSARNDVFAHNAQNPLQWCIC
jgi:DNA repair exonuclease SbcCD ATPase subunit